MTIGIDCRLSSTTHTGIGRYIAELLRYLPQIDDKNQYRLYFNQPEFESYIVPNARFQKFLVNIPHYGLDEQFRWCYFLLKEPLDLLHVPHFNAPLLYKKPMVVTIHDLTLHYYPNKSYHPRFSLKKLVQIAAYQFLFRTVVRRAKHLIAVSRHTASDLIHEYHVPEEKITTIYEGVPEEFQKPSAEIIAAVKEKFHITKPYFSYLGSWRSHKNLLNLIKAFSLGLQEDYQLVLIGKKDPEYPEVFHMIERFSLSNATVMTDFVSDEDLIALLSGSLAFVFPSLYEGFGLPPLEAMRLEIPVLASNAASIPEVCGEAALFFDPGSSEDIANKMRQMADDEAFRKACIEKGKKNLERFSFQSMTRQIVDIYQK